MNDKQHECAECAVIHADFIGQFGRWPHMGHEESQRLKRTRADNLRSWDKLDLPAERGEQ
jgi:hypothetical protein